MSRTGSYYGYVPNRKKGPKGGERTLAWEGIDRGVYNNAVKYFERNAVDDDNDIHRAWAIERIGGW
eukprot:1931080-Rhodomonas_salina.1